MTRKIVSKNIQYMVLIPSEANQVRKYSRGQNLESIPKVAHQTKQAEAEF